MPIDTTPPPETAPHSWLQGFLHHPPLETIIIGAIAIGVIAAIVVAYRKYHREGKKNTIPPLTLPAVASNKDEVGELDPPFPFRIKTTYKADVTAMDTSL